MEENKKMQKEKDSLLEYMEKNGTFLCGNHWISISENGNWAHDVKTFAWSWFRDHPYIYEYNFLTHKDLEKLEKSWLAQQLDKELNGKLPDPTIEEYNMLASAGEWYGGYVQGLGFVEQAASSLYGAPIYNNSWIQRGEPDNPVSQGQFYKFKKEGRWHGGFVDTWDYVSASKNILGSSYGKLQVVNDGESFLGAIINASTMIAYGGLTYEGTKETFADYYDRDVKKYLIPSNELSTILNRYFIASAIERMDDIDNALSKHLPVFVRHITEKVTLSNGEEISYGEDGLIVDMSIRKNELTILNAANFQVYTEKYYFMKSEDFIFFKLEQQ